MAARTDVTHLTAREQEALSAFVRRLREHFDGQVLSVLLFGSRARNEAQPDSDVDVAVILDRADAETRKAIRHLAVETWLEYGFYLSTRVWSRAKRRWKPFRNCYLSTRVWSRGDIIPSKPSPSYLSTRVWSREHWRRLEAMRTGLYRNLRRDGIELLTLP